jgi:hypothetical protein
MQLFRRGEKPFAGAMQSHKKNGTSSSSFFLLLLLHTSYPLAYEDGTDSFPKRRLLNTTRRATTKKITRNIQNTAKA